MKYPEKITFNDRPADFHHFETQVKRPKSFSLACPEYVKGLRESENANGGSNFSYSLSSAASCSFELSVYLLNRTKNGFQLTSKGTDYGVTIATATSPVISTDDSITLDAVFDARHKQVQERIYAALIDAYLTGTSITTKKYSFESADPFYSMLPARMQNPTILSRSDHDTPLIKPICGTDGIQLQLSLHHPTVQRREGFITQTEVLFDYITDFFNDYAFQIPASHLYAADVLQRINREVEHVSSEQILERQVEELYASVDSLLFEKAPLREHAHYMQSLASELSLFRYGEIQKTYL
jgi:hypothetical protein